MKELRQSQKLLLLLGVTLAVVAGVVWLILPDQEDILRRLIADNRLDRAAELAGKMSGWRKARNPVFYRLVDCKLERRALCRRDAKGNLDDISAERLFEKVWKLHQAHPGDERFVLEMSSIMARTRNWRLIQECFVRMKNDFSGKMLKHFLQAFQRESLETNNPAALAAVRRILWKDEPLTLNRVSELVSGWRGGGFPAEAVKDLDRYVNEGGDGAEKRLLLVAEQRIALLREQNCNSEAFDFILRNQQTLEKRLSRHKVLDYLALTATQAGRSAEAIPAYRQWVDEHPDDVEDLEILAGLYAGARHFKQAIQTYRQLMRLRPDDERYEKWLAQIYEWNGQPGEAFAIYARMAAKGNEAALDRLIQLNQGLFRDRETIEILRRCIPAKGSGRRLQTLADLLVRQGMYAEAEALLRRHLKEEPGDTQAWWLVAVICREFDRLEEARDACQKILEVRPDHFPARKSLAELTYLLGDYEKAFEKLRVLARDSADMDVLSQYVASALHLGRFDEMVKALELFTQRNKTPGVFDYLQLAYYQNLTGDKEGAVRTLETGMARMGNDPRLRTEAARQTLQGGNRARALELLEGKVFQDSPDDLIAVYFEVLDACGRQKEALNLARQLPRETLRRSRDLAAVAAGLFENCGDWGRAWEVYRHWRKCEPESVDWLMGYARTLAHRGYRAEADAALAGLAGSERPEDLQLMAQFYMEMERPRDAVRKWERYCRHVKEPDSMVWRYLGDARLAAGGCADSQGRVWTSLETGFEGASGAMRGTFSIRVLMGMVLWTGLIRLAAGGNLLAGDAAAGIKEQEIYQYLPDLPAETKQQILYLAARLNRPRLAEAMVRDLRAMKALNREACLVMAGMYLERRDAARTELWAREVLRMDPSDVEGWYYVASAFSHAGRHAEAEAILKRLRRQIPGRYPYLTDLAAAAKEAGDWREAIRSYRELLERGQDGESLRHEARANLDELYREYNPRLETKTDWLSLNSGSIVRSEADYGQMLDEWKRLVVNWHMDVASQHQRDASVDYQRERHEGLAGLDLFLGDGWHAGAAAGGSNSGAVATGKIRWDYEPGCELMMSIDYNERATDSLTMECLDGRQDQMSAEIKHALTPTTLFNWVGNVRQARVESERIGESYGFDWGVEEILMRKPIELALGYQGQYMAYSALSENIPEPWRIVQMDDPNTTLTSTAGGLIDTRIHREGLSLTARCHILPQWSCEAGALTGYSFVQEMMDYGFSLATGVMVRKSLEIRLHAAYLSSGSQSNNASAVKELGLAVKSYF
ncbi:MAG: tetratricopeptide repeat protein [Verrucomicrobiae bacterium]|nr:tetratricopeptide repeat protein [Verrucomicrobiae bacterium]